MSLSTTIRAAAVGSTMPRDAAAGSNPARRRRVGLFAGFALAALAATPASAQVTKSTYGGANPMASLGRDVRPAGDIDKDGFPDWIVGVPGNTVNGTNSGSSFIISGKFNVATHPQHGGHAQDHFGYSVDGGTDINKDGWPDYVVGAYSETTSAPEAGTVRVYSGKTDAVLYTFSASKAEEGLGTHVRFVGDVNKDGWPDVAASALLGEGPTGQLVGWVRVWSGANGGVLYTFYGTQQISAYGLGLESAGDWDKDGYADILIGSPYDSTAGASAGRLEVRSGKTGAILLQRFGSAGDELGYSVAPFGDIDHDGWPDLLAGAVGQSGAGAVTVLHGPGGVAGLSVTGSSQFDGFGTTVVAVGDVDKDGTVDFAVGAPQSGPVKTGYARIFSGSSGALLWSTINGAGPGWALGSSLAATGDMDGDGWLELVIGAPGADGDGTDTGEARVMKCVVQQPDLGFGGPGIATLAVIGTPLYSGGKADLRLTGASPSKPVFLLASAALDPVAFKGGILAPKIAGSLVFGFASNAAGQLILPGIPGGFGAFDITVQAVIKDNAFAQGYDFSNAVRMEFQP
jgi:FG-GAP-like repeat/FG-GAP repeat